MTSFLVKNRFFNDVTYDDVINSGRNLLKTLGKNLPVFKI